MFHDRAPRIRRILAGIPAERAAAVELFDDLDGFGDVRALCGFIDVLVTDSVQAVAGNFVPQLLKSSGRFGVALQRATPNTVSGRLRSSNTCNKRQTPAREPYLYSDSMLMWRAGEL